MMAFGAGSCGLGSLSLNYVLLQYSKRKMIVAEFFILHIIKFLIKVVLMKGSWLSNTKVFLLFYNKL